MLLQLTPGDPVRLMLGPKAGPDAIAFVRARYGLDQPIFVQYFYYLKNALQGDFGQSIAFRAPVSQVILERIAPTIYLILYGLAISIALTLLMSISAARQRGRWADHLIRFLCVAGVGVPSYFIGLMLMAGISPLGILLGKSCGRLLQAALLLTVQFPFTWLAIT